MGQKPLITLIVPCYNQGVFLNENLQSVYDQTYSNWECFIIDDGSTDTTAQIAQSWASRDKRFNYYQKDNNGLAAARNFGLDKASGSYIQFLDADDFIDSNKLQASINAIERDRSKNIIITEYLQYNQFTGVTEKSHFRLTEDLLTYNKVIFEWDNNFAIPIHCGLFSSDLFEDFRFPEDLKAKEDWVMWVKFFQNDISIHFIKEPLAFYRRHSANMTTNKNMSIDYMKALKYVRDEVPSEDYILLLELKIGRLSNTVFSLREQIRFLKGNLGWKIYNKLVTFFNR